MELITEPYLAQATRWATEEPHILAQHDAETVVVYQAYNPSIGRFAAAHGYFGGGFSLARMSWIKPNFLWMMYRSGWGTKLGQEITLAIWLQRAAFVSILRAAVPSTFEPDGYHSEPDWRAAVAQSDVRVQWDPDHDPSGKPLDRRAIQLGLRGATLASYVREWIVEIADISSFVAEQREHAHPPYAHLVTPHETVLTSQQ